ncbi:hypothetical protein NW767_015596 [Fusarium falciforme]|nr:hypothetical protein NW767_015596 [Fusarium falciforme]
MPRGRHRPFLALGRGYQSALGKARTHLPSTIDDQKGWSIADYPHIDPRFHYGELRLSRLSKIYRLRRNLLHGYMPRWNQYSDFIRDNFALLAGSTVYIAIVLTAMQAGLGSKLRDNDAFKAASYGFTVFSILGPLIAAALIVLAFFSVFVYNWVITVNYRKRRLASMQADRST